MKKIMIADDDPSIVEAIKIVLEEEGYSVCTTADGEAVKDIKKDLPDLLLLDIWMSGMNGGEIAAHLKKNDKTKAIPIIMVSANRDCESIARECGADGFLSKPFDIDDLLDRVERYVA